MRKRFASRNKIRSWCGPLWGIIVRVATAYASHKTAFHIMTSTHQFAHAFADLLKVCNVITFAYSLGGNQAYSILGKAPISTSLSRLLPPHYARASTLKQSNLCTRTPCSHRRRLVVWNYNANHSTSRIRFVKRTDLLRQRNGIRKRSTFFRRIFLHTQQQHRALNAVQTVRKAEWKERHSKKAGSKEKTGKYVQWFRCAKKLVTQSQ